MDSHYWDRMRRHQISRRTLLRRASVAGVGAAGLALVGCGDDDDDSAPAAAPAAAATPAPAAAAAPAATPAPAAQAEQQAQQQAQQAAQQEQPAQEQEQQAQPAPAAAAVTPKGTVQAAVVTLADQNVDPVTQTAGNNRPLFYNMWEHFESRSPVDSTWQPELALTTERPAPETMIFHLRPDVKFWDTSLPTMTAEDVVWSAERIRFVQPEPPGLATIIANYDIPTAPDASTVVVNLLPDGVANALRTAGGGPRGWGVMSKAHWDKVGEEAFKTNPQGTGPWAIDDNVIQDHSNLKAHAAHWGRVPYFERFNMAIVPEQATRVARLQTGEAQFADGILGAPFAQLQSNADLQIFNVPGTAITGIHYHSSGEAPYNDPRFREAAQLAVDQEALIAGLLGIGAVGPELKMFPTVDAWDAAKFPLHTFDAAKAAELLDAAGLKGSNVKLQGYDSSSTPLIPEMLEAIVGMWREVGINAELNIQEAASHFAAWRNREITGMAALSTPSWWEGIGLLNTHYISTGAYAAFVDQELDDLVTAARAEPTEAGQAAANQKAFLRAQDIHIMVTMPWVTSAWATRKDTVSEWIPQAGSPYPINFASMRGPKSA